MAHAVTQYLSIISGCMRCKCLIKNLVTRTTKSNEKKVFLMSMSRSLRYQFLKIYEYVVNHLILQTHMLVIEKVGI